MRTDLMKLSIFNKRSSGTSIIPILDLFELKAKLLDSALVLEIQLKIVVLPVFVIPIMPHLSPM